MQGQLERHTPMWRNVTLAIVDPVPTIPTNTLRLHTSTRLIITREPPGDWHMDQLIGRVTSPLRASGSRRRNLIYHLDLHQPGEPKADNSENLVFCPWRPAISTAIAMQASTTLKASSAPNAIRPHHVPGIHLSSSCYVPRRRIRILSDVMALSCDSDAHLRFSVPLTHKNQLLRRNAVVALSVELPTGCSRLTATYSSMRCKVGVSDYQSGLVMQG
ncbi:hypothetical protein FHL15_009924 [Xylaria flabelliformis]|uniref:Uncharacterized protein n=1 Tax=Xylaria flabelliformis TaxID=2512241 RepID=A0A553HMT2_9PEZI|nr:hypothetical protein FHL15_009924 [Xylaria flabelliformis]